MPILKSKDGGKTFTSISRENVHSDHQALWVNPNRTGHLINGNDGGLNMSYDDGENWIKLNSPSVGQFYAIYADNQKSYKVYGGLQDMVFGLPIIKLELIKGGILLGRILMNLLWGDGMQVQG